MLKKIIYILILLTFSNICLFAGQQVVSQAPDYNETNEMIIDPGAAVVVANASEEALTAQLYYNNFPLENETIISQDNNNQDLLLSESWELTPFSIKINGSELYDYGLNIELEVGFFQLLDSNGNIAQGNQGYIIDEQSMKIENLTEINGVSFENTPSGSNSYFYNIPLSNSLYYNQKDMAIFKLTWQEKDILQPGNYISNIQITFSID